MEWAKILSSARLRPSRKSSDTSRDRRNAFESDFGRINFSPAIRRMHDKTQVIPLTTNDNIHTRLTHSIEVQSVAYSMGVSICSNSVFRKRLRKPESELLRVIPTILSCTALAHDIGNPPFGHFGEKVISEFFEKKISNSSSIQLSEIERLDFIKFDGNAQGFRVLTKTQVLQDNYGLNLTLATLSAFLKYPVLSDEIDTSHKYKRKIGIFQSEKDHLLRIREETELIQIRHPLAFLMEAADTICYTIMDIEDGFNAHYYSFQDIVNYLLDLRLSSVTKFVNQFLKYAKRSLQDKLNYDAACMVNFRVAVIRHLVSYACNEFMANLDGIESGIYDKELVKTNDLTNSLSRFCNEKLFSRREVCSLELTGESVLKGLLNYFIDDLLDCKNDGSDNFKKADKLYKMLSESIRTIAMIEYPGVDWYHLPDYGKLRLILDYVTGMTDFFAVDVFQRLSGIRIG